MIVQLLINDLLKIYNFIASSRKNFLWININDWTEFHVCILGIKSKILLVSSYS